MAIIRRQETPDQTPDFLSTIGKIGGAIIGGVTGGPVGAIEGAKLGGSIGAGAGALTKKGGPDLKGALGAVEGVAESAPGAAKANADQALSNDIADTTSKGAENVVTQATQVPDVGAQFASKPYEPVSADFPGAPPSPGAFQRRLGQSWRLIP